MQNFYSHDVFHILFLRRLFVDVLFIFWKLFKGLHFSATCVRPSRVERCDNLSSVPVPVLFSLTFDRAASFARLDFSGTFIVVSSFLDSPYLAFLSIFSLLLSTMSSQKTGLW